jgi:protoporphyrinogen oxidase
MTNFILGGGVTGLAAGLASGWPILEALQNPGGICSSYYVRPGSQERLNLCPADGEVYHFEIGGGHWIFGGDPSITEFITRITPVRHYSRDSSVYFRAKDLYVPYPLQNHLRFLDSQLASQALTEMATIPGPFTTMKEWLLENFGPTLCALFFEPFHKLYTANLQDRIAPQDAYKSPVNLQQAIQGALQDSSPVGYNTTFIYPQNGLNTLAQHMASHCEIHYGKRVVQIELQTKQLYFSDNSIETYDALISTLPLNRMLELTQLTPKNTPDPYTSVLVLNIGAERGPRCPHDHWLYNPDAQSGFHRVGFYSNVDRLFLPKSAQDSQNRVSIYVERAFLGGMKPSPQEIKQYADMVVRELQSWGFIENVEVVDPTWIDVAYTWSLPDSRWKQEALAQLQDHKIYQVGRYGRWFFQGIADSIRDGFFVGASLKTYG